MTFLRSVALLVILFSANTFASEPRSSSDSTVVILLGTGTPYPNPLTQGPATIVTVGDRVFLFDAGSGVMRQMKAAGLPIHGVTACFITHLHSDHTLGLADLILTSWIMRRKSGFPIFGPKGLQKMTDHLMAAYEDDIRIRTEGFEREIPEALPVKIVEIKSGVVYDSAGVRVTAISVPHGDWQAFGFRIDTGNRSIVISGDTRYSEALLSASRDVDVLVHEVYPAARLAPEDRPGGEFWPAYMKDVHTSDVELGQLAAAPKPGLLLLTHIVRMGASDEEILRGIRQGGFGGKVLVGHDLGRY